VTVPLVTHGEFPDSLGPANEREVDMNLVTNHAAAYVPDGRARRRMTPGAAAALLVALLAAPAAHAGLLGASKPSQLITLMNGPGAKCVTGEVRLGTQVNGDGTTSAFTIPAGMVLVLTGIEWDGGALSAGATTLYVFLENANAGSVGLVAVGGAVTQSGGAGMGGGTFGTGGIVVKPGTDICLGTNGSGSVQGTAHGFLAKDK
jgi:hypothetical protein